MSEKNSSRTLINIIGVPSILAIIIAGDTYMNLPLFSIFIGIVLLLGAKEIPILVKESKGAPFLPILFIFLIILQVTRHPLINFQITVFELLILITILTMFFELFRKEKTPFLNISCIVFSFIWVGVMLGSISLLRNIPVIGFSITMSIFLTVWICDTAAFGFGLKFGRSKILPTVSPNKTWVGSIAGMISSIIIMIVLYRVNFFKRIHVMTISFYRTIRCITCKK